MSYFHRSTQCIQFVSQLEEFASTFAFGLPFIWSELHCTSFLLCKIEIKRNQRRFNCHLIFILFGFS
jgi:hypothetical protein